MLEPKIKRKFRSFSVSLTTSEPTSTPIRVEDVAGGAVGLGTSATTLSSIAVWASESPTTAFGLLRKADGTEVTITLSQSTADRRVYTLPDECYGVGAVKLVANNAVATGVSCIAMLKG